MLERTRRHWRSVRAFLVMLGLAALVAAAPLGAVVANLDADPRLESVHGLGPTLRKRVVLEDRCAGVPVRFRLSPTHDAVEFVRVRDVDGFGERPEVVLELRTGGGGHLGITKILRLGARGEPGCAEPVTLFRYRPDAPRLEPPAAFAPTNWTVRVRDLSARFRGKEIRLWEGYVDRDDPLCCPSKQRVTRFRFDPDVDRYVVYQTRVSDVD